MDEAYTFNSIKVSSINNVILIISNEDIPLKIAIANEGLLDITNDSSSYAIKASINSKDLCLIIREFMVYLLKCIEVDYVIRIPFKNSSRIKLNECEVFKGKEFKKKKPIQYEPEVLVTNAFLFDDNFSIYVLLSARSIKYEPEAEVEVDIVQVKQQLSIEENNAKTDENNLSSKNNDENQTKSKQQEQEQLQLQSKPMIDSPRIINKKDIILQNEPLNDKSSTLILNNNNNNNHNETLLLKNNSIKESIVAYNTSFPSFPTIHLSPKGLDNPSVYCFMNTCFQCLLSIPELNHYFRTSKYLNDCKSKQIKPFASNAFMELIINYTNESSSLMASRSVYNVCHSFLPKGHQHDCQEFLRRFLARIQEELSYQSKYSFENVTTKEQAWKIYKAINPSFIDTLFTGLMHSNVKCAKCSHVSKTFDPFLDISVSIKRDLRQNLDNCLGMYFQNEYMDTDYKCEKCKKKTSITKKLDIAIYPLILTIQIKRFEEMHKLNNHIDFKHTMMIGDYTYSLFAVAVHLGHSISLGHYIAYVKRKNKWYYISDSSVEKCSENDVLECEAYLLFYRMI